jgi:organic radical activating enzyme
LGDRYRLKGGRVFNRACEVNIVEHCNLRCRSCAHLSPALPRHFVDLGALSSDLTALARSYRAKVLRLLGGEPLLHPDLLEIMTAARESHVADKIEITTNGLLLPRVERCFWEVADGVQISLYPGRSLRQDQLDTCIDLARRNNVSIRCRRYQSFQESYSEQGTDDPALVEKIYVTCNSAHRWRCHTVANGWFFKCAQGYMIPKGMSLGAEATYRNGIQIDESPEFRDRLLSYLTSPEPLPSCRNCLGSAGRYIEHQDFSVGRLQVGPVPSDRGSDSSPARGGDAGGPGQSGKPPSKDSHGTSRACPQVRHAHRARPQGAEPQQQPVPGLTHRDPGNDLNWATGTGSKAGGYSIAPA